MVTEYRRSLDFMGSDLYQVSKHFSNRLTNRDDHRDFTVEYLVLSVPSVFSPL